MNEMTSLEIETMKPNAAIENGFDAAFNQKLTFRMELCTLYFLICTTFPSIAWSNKLTTNLLRYLQTYELRHEMCSPSGITQ